MKPNTQPLEILVQPGDAGARLDQFLAARFPRVTRGEARRLLLAGLVRVDGRRGTKGIRLREGQRVSLMLAEGLDSPVPCPRQPLVVLVEREDLVVIHKPAGIPCHPLLPGETGTVVNALLARYPECASAGASPREGGLVHRLDRPTSGVLLAARDAAAYRLLREHFGGHRVQKEYLALVDGDLPEPTEIEVGLRPVPGDPGRMEASPDTLAPVSEQASSSVTPLQRLGGRTLVRVSCRTGKRHQVRAHLAHIGHPLAGDERYGGRPLEGSEGAFLHASRVLLPDGLGDFAAALPRERQEILEGLEDSSPRPPR